MNQYNNNNNSNNNNDNNDNNEEFNSTLEKQDNSTYSNYNENINFQFPFLNSNEQLKKKKEENIIPNDNNNNNNNNTKRNHNQPSACDSCRLRKLKCDISKPQCSSCKKRNIICQYSQLPFKSNKPNEYIKSLNERIEELENLLNGHPIKKDNNINNNNNNNNKLLNINQLEHPMFQSHEAIIEHLIECFFKYKTGFMEFIDPIIFLNDYHQKKLDPLMLYTICAIGSKFSPYFSILSTKESPAGKAFADKAEPLLMERFTRTPSLDSIKAGLLLGCFEFMAGRGEMAVYFLSCTQRAAQYIGLNFLDSTMLFNPQNPWQLDEVERHQRRLVWWECLASDVLAGSLVGRPLIIDDRDYVVNLPNADTIEAQYFVQLYTLIQIWRELFRFTHHRHLRKWHNNHIIQEKVDYFHFQLINFLKLIPKPLQFDLNLKPTKSLKSAILLYLLTHMLIILLHRSHLMIGFEGENITEKEFQSQIKCIESAGEIGKAIEFYSDYLIELNDVYSSFSVFNAASILANLQHTDKKRYGYSFTSHFKLMKEFLKLHNKVWYMNSMFLETLKLIDKCFQRLQFNSINNNNDNNKITLKWLAPTSTSYLIWYFANVSNY